MDQAALYNEIAGGTPPMGYAPYRSDYAPWRVTLPVLNCPSEALIRANSSTGQSTYAFCGGDSNTRMRVDDGDDGGGTGMTPRGVFGYCTSTRFRDITDGTSNTIMLAELVRPTAPHEPSREWGNAPQGNPHGQSPTGCLNVFNRLTRTYTTAIEGPPGSDTGGRFPGARWADGAARYTGFNTILAPNGPSCGRGNNHRYGGIFSAGSRHTGGVQVVMGDGSVRFISENIDAGDVGYSAEVTQGISPYGVWGALGSKSGGEVIPTF